MDAVEKRAYKEIMTVLNEAHRLAPAEGDVRLRQLIDEALMLLAVGTGQEIVHTHSGCAACRAAEKIGV